MPPRPSRNLDLALLAAGRALLPHRGCAGLSVREVADAAGVNLGMFHYHFKSREAFLRALLQSMYEEMYAQLTFEADQKLGPIEALRAALRFMGRFVRTNRPILARVLGDALCGDPLAVEFLRNNFPRHLGVIMGLIQAAQAEGLVRPMPPPQAMGICAGSLAMPILVAGAVVESGAMGPEGTKMITEALLTDAALDQRIELALLAISNPSAVPRARARKTRGKK
ncbi:MAG TPA: TetR/AcrR family transcriptional regulator [Usitatibacter sp.]|nr:TetR/AcrR family transcriptional regulator [Usitatibacter sp.]